MGVCLDKLHKWITENGLKFFKEKTKCVYFCNQWKLHLDNTKIPVVDQCGLKLVTEPNVE